MRRMVFRKHAIQRMFERDISVDEVVTVVNNGRVIQDYPHDDPYPSRLLLCRVNERALHVVCADVPGNEEVFIITVYEPDASQWEPGFERRKP